MQHATERVERPGESQEALEGKKNTRGPGNRTTTSSLSATRVPRYQLHHEDDLKLRQLQSLIQDTRNKTDDAPQSSMGGDSHATINASN